MPRIRFVRVRCPHRGVEYKVAAGREASPLNHKSASGRTKDGAVSRRPAPPVLGQGSYEATDVTDWHGWSCHQALRTPPHTSPNAREGPRSQSVPIRVIRGRVTPHGSAARGLALSRGAGRTTHRPTEAAAWVRRVHAMARYSHLLVGAGRRSAPLCHQGPISNWPQPWQRSTQQSQPSGHHTSLGSCPVAASNRGGA